VHGLGFFATNVLTQDFLSNKIMIIMTMIMKMILLVFCCWPFLATFFVFGAVLVIQPSGHQAL
jgi:hypothetical protein